MEGKHLEDHLLPYETVGATSAILSQILSVHAAFTVLRAPQSSKKNTAYDPAWKHLGVVTDLPITVETPAVLSLNIYFDCDLVKVGYYGNRRQLPWLVAIQHYSRVARELRWDTCLAFCRPLKWAFKKKMPMEERALFSACQAHLWWSDRQARNMKAMAQQRARRRETSISWTRKESEMFLVEVNYSCGSVD